MNPYLPTPQIVSPVPEEPAPLPAPPPEMSMFQGPVQIQAPPKRKIPTPAEIAAIQAQLQGMRKAPVQASPLTGIPPEAYAAREQMQGIQAAPVQAMGISDPAVEDKILNELYAMYGIKK